MTRPMLTQFASIVLVVTIPLAARVQAQIEAEAFTEPYHEIELAAREAGILAEMNVREGDQVEENQIVARLDTDVLDASLKIAQVRSKFQGSLKAALAERDLRAKHVEQFRVLRKRGHATQRELERAEADFQIAEARVQMAEEELQLQRLECDRIEAQIERRQIRSPIQGVVSEVKREVGESFSASEPEVMKIVQLDRLRAKFSLTPTEAAGFQTGDEVTLRLTNPSRQAKGVVETVFPVMDAKSGTLIIAIVIENSKQDIRSGDRCFMKASAPNGSTTRFTTK